MKRLTALAVTIVAALSVLALAGTASAHYPVESAAWSRVAGDCVARYGACNFWFDFAKAGDAHDLYFYMQRPWSGGSWPTHDCVEIYVIDHNYTILSRTIYTCG